MSFRATCVIFPISAITTIEEVSTNRLIILEDDDVTKWLHHQLTRPTINPNNRWLNDSNTNTPTSNSSRLDSPRSQLISSNMSRASGYETNESQPRRTSRITTPARLDPGMIQPSQDSRCGLFLPPLQLHSSIASSAVNPTGRKRGRTTSISDSETASSHVPCNQPHRSNLTGNKKKKKIGQKKPLPPPSHPFNQKPKSDMTIIIAGCFHCFNGYGCFRKIEPKQISGQGPSIDLRQDSDEENTRIRKRSKTNPDPKEDNYDDIALYFGAPTAGDKDFN
ncbi:uncharacterized protein MELLADRAFT_93074 [Melampsora larici-populina 98AG31]|uniref:Uncharacterized protein n=1 Tax=Melampsora larici-populina (strain 98AG31 / pathotype 3-4-7) TaxID=747676 RepID=F4S3U7_MELLP|nr:uncharacterized protein MELLADRAFT_93074 [Melampsora larici-populina 98AG31]EGG00597.1 hypothetical protein MELLADRAFT_93074 [Melampsora larici-populina 98AG31]